MAVERFDISWFSSSKTLKDTKSKFSGGQVVIVGGSELFHGAPIMAMKACSRIVSMLYFACPKEDKGVVEKIKTSLQAFVWVPQDDLDGYIAKSDAVLIGPGMMRSHTKEHGFVCDEEGQNTRRIVLEIFKKFPDKKMVVDGGALQVVSVEEIPVGSVITPNSKEFEMIFGVELTSDIDKRVSLVSELALKHNLVILIKDEMSIITNGTRTILVDGGSDGLVKGGVGDVTAGVILGFLAKDEPIMACSLASYLVKVAGKKLMNEKGLMFNAQDLAEEIPSTYKSVLDDL